VRGLDTNVLLRTFLSDEPSQTATANRLFEEAAATGKRLFVTCVVLCEMCWALRNKDYSRASIADAIESLFAVDALEIQDRDLVRHAALQFRQGRGDFADYLIGWQNRQAGCSETLTFDRKLRKTAGFSVLVAEN
jgi:predicted nucleic-acid-binding protein